MCGWPIAGSSSWDTGLVGYLLPTTTGCVNYTYYDYLQQPMQRRAAWMQSNLVSCSCDWNPSRQLSYEECVQQRKPCRSCVPFLEYHDDARRVCVPCGSTCEPGYHASTSGCSAANASLALTLTLSKQEQQALLGCVPCPFSDGAQYVEGCAHTCRRDASVVNHSLDYFCSVSQGGVGVCAESCERCSGSYALQKDELLTSKAVGKYITGCSDVTGHQVADCTNRLPANAHYTSSSLDAHDCLWACDEYTYASLDKLTCIPCPTWEQQVTSCASGEVRTACFHNRADAESGIRQSYFCQPCSELDAWKRLDANGLTRIYSENPWRICYEDCKDGVAWSIISTESCTLCSRLERCDPGYKVQACVRRNDTQCVPCPLLRVGFEYVSAGVSCATQCASGYYSRYGECLACAELEPCGDGMMRAHACTLERSSAPECVPCSSSSLGPHQRWNGCTKVCFPGYYYLRECLECNVTACAVGTKATCSNNVQQCIPCGETGFPSDRILEGSHREYIVRGICTQGCQQVNFPFTAFLCAFYVFFMCFLCALMCL